jgi:hypothetical protein
VLEDTPITSGTLTARAEDRLLVSFPSASSPSMRLCPASLPDQIIGTFDAHHPGRPEHRGPRSESSALNIVPTRAMMWTGSVRSSTAVTTNMAKKTIAKEWISGNPCSTACRGSDGNGGVIHRVLQ